MPWNRLTLAFPLVVGEINSSALSPMASEGHFQFGMTDVVRMSSDEMRLDGQIEQFSDGCNVPVLVVHF